MRSARKWKTMLTHRVHQTLKTPAMVATGVTKRLWEMADVVDVLEAWEASEK